MIGLNEGQTKLVILLGYLLLLLVLGGLANRLFRGTKKDYLLASHSIGPVFLLLSMFGTTMTAFAIVGSSAEAYQKGTGVYGLLASGSGIVHSLCFYLIGVRLYRHGRRFGYSTQIEFFRDRVESKLIGFLMFPILVGLIIPYLMIGVIGGGIVISTSTVGAFPGITENGSLPIWAGSLVICLVVLTYVFLGGMRGTTWANAFQTIVFVTLGAYAFYRLTGRLGDHESFWENFVQLNRQISDSAGQRNQISQSIFACYLMIPLSVAMFPHLFQHWLTAKSSNTFKLPVVMHPIFIMLVWVPCVLIGTWATSVLGPDVPANGVMPIMVNKFIGPVTGGFLAAGILAAIMSSLDSQFLCIGSMFTNDIVENVVKTQLSDQSQVRWARYFVIGVVGVTYLLCLLSGFQTSIFTMAIWCFSGFAGLFPIVLAALYWKRLTASGVLAGLLTALGSWCYLFYLSSWGMNDGRIRLSIPPGSDNPFEIMPVVIIFASTAIATVLTSLITRRPSAATINKFFN